MSVTFVKRSELPASVKGKEATSSVSVSEAGQLVCSSLVTKNLDGSANVVMAFDGLKVYIFREDSPYIQSALKKKLISEKDMITLRRSSKKDPGSNFAFSGSQILQNMVKYGASVQYDYKASKNQTFPAIWDDKNKAVSFDLPSEGKMTPKVSAPRVKKVKTVATSANPGSIQGAPMVEDELVLDPA